MGNDPAWLKLWRKQDPKFARLSSDDRGLYYILVIEAADGNGVIGKLDGVKQAELVGKMVGIASAERNTLHYRIERLKKEGFLAQVEDRLLIPNFSQHMPRGWKGSAGPENPPATLDEPSTNPLATLGNIPLDNHPESFNSGSTNENKNKSVCVATGSGADTHTTDRLFENVRQACPELASDAHWSSFRQSIEQYPENTTREAMRDYLQAHKNKPRAYLLRMIQNRASEGLKRPQNATDDGPHWCSHEPGVQTRGRAD